MPNTAFDGVEDSTEPWVRTLKNFYGEIDILLQMQALHKPVLRDGLFLLRGGVEPSSGKAYNVCMINGRAELSPLN